MKNLLVLILGLSTVLADDANVQLFRYGNREFTGTVYNEVKLDSSDNFFISPYSLETVLALTQSGAVGKTGQEIRATLNLPDDPQQIETLFKSVLPTIKSDKFLLESANKIYVEQNVQIKEQYKDVATDVYQAQFQNIEFSERSSAAKEINDWVAEETHGKIQDLVTPEDLNENTRVLLVNALYFKANWSNQFKISNTKKGEFLKISDDSVNVDFINVHSQQANYYESEELDAKFLELPFVGGASMTIVLPNQKEGIGFLENQISRTLITPQYTKQFVQVSVPKFKIESTIDFKRILQQLGVRTAFTPLADFSGIAGEPGNLYIDKIVQKTYIDVNEKGVEAAASTDSVAGFLSAPPEPRKTFVADHPFLFYIKFNDVILFEGRVFEPKY